MTSMTNQPKFRGHGIADRLLLTKHMGGRMQNTITDRSLTQDILDASGADKDAVAGKKVLFDILTLSPVTTPYNQTRTYTSEMTMPWGKSGWRCIAVGKYEDYIAKQNTKFMELDIAVEAFADNIEGHIQAQQRRLGSLWRYEDYPTADEFRSYWHHKIETDQVASTDVRAKVDAAQRGDIEMQIKSRLAEQFSSVWQEAAERLAASVQHVAKILNSDGANGKRRSPVNLTLIENLRTQVEVTREMAVAVDDTNLLNLTREVEEKLLQIPAEQLAANEGVKATVGKEAEFLATRAAREVVAVDKRVQDMLTEFSEY